MEKINFLIRNTTLDTKVRMFQYKVLEHSHSHSFIYANKILLKLGKVTSLRSSFSKLHDETIIHLIL